jgi:dTMP kinase
MSRGTWPTCATAAAFRYPDPVRGRFITFEGIEGVGKSTQLAHAATYLRGRGIDLLTTREPGGTPLAEALRALVLKRSEQPVSVTAELLMIFAARASHVTDVISPALAGGRWVLCDRFTDCTEAYQGAGDGVAGATIRELAAIAHPDLMPDLTLLLDAPPTVAHARVASRGASLDRFEAESEKYFGRVRRGYLDIAAREPDRVRLIDATGNAKQVAAAISRELDRCLAGTE